MNVKQLGATFLIIVDYRGTKRVNVAITEDDYYYK